MTASGPAGDARALNVLSHFDLGGAVAGIAALPGGHINASWTVSVAPPTPARPTDRTPAHFVLQRLNEQVFPNPEQVMENIAQVTRHLGAALAREGAREPERRALRLVPARDGGVFHRDGDGGVWRVYPFIEGTATREFVRSPAEAREVGRAFGTFQRLLADYDGPRLHETIPHFHDSVWRFEALERAVAEDRMGRVAGVRGEIAAALARRELAGVIPGLHATGAAPERIAHYDAKSANVLLDASTGEALCVVDLDTVMPGSALYDFGDMVRSASSPTAEDERDLGAVGARTELFQGLAEGYLERAGASLTPAERDHLVFAGQLITWEQAMRFLTDHLDGDRYFRTAYAKHNLVRCRTQLKLLGSLERQADTFHHIVREASTR